MPEQVRLVLHRQRRAVMVELPPDDVGYGFDNIGEVLSLPPFLMKKYLRAANHVVDQVAGEGRNRSRIFSLRRRPPNRETAEEILTQFVRRAFRRPARPEEVQRYLALFDLATEKGEPFADALKVPFQAVLISPHFLFRVERGVADEEENSVRPLSDHELATRLSYFLWSTMPDDELFWHRYPIEDKRRGGILAMAAPLLETSNATRTSPVRRGKWILQSLLAAPPPPPPPNVPELDEIPTAESKLSLREKLEVHRANPACASCHRRMDPLGFALENYDAIGAWREKDGGRCRPAAEKVGRH